MVRDMERCFGPFLYKYACRKINTANHFKQADFLTGVLNFLANIKRCITIIWKKLIFI